MTAPKYAFCEPVNATYLSKEHLRRVGPEGLKVGGGVPTPALCGRDLRAGWDLTRQVTPEAVRVMSTPRGGDDRVLLCPDCAQVYAAEAVSEQ